MQASEGAHQYWLQDQASGLRELFVPQNAYASVLWAPNTITRLQAVRGWIKNRQHHSEQGLVLDASYGDLIRMLGLSARFELSQVLEGYVRFHSAAHCLYPDCWIISAARALQSITRQRLALGDMLSWFTRSMIRPDAILSTLEHESANNIAAWCSVDGTIIFALDHQAGTMVTAYQLLKNISSRAPWLTIELWPIDTTSMQSATQISETAWRFLGRRIEVITPKETTHVYSRRYA